MAPVPDKSKHPVFAAMAFEHGLVCHSVVGRGFDITVDYTVSCGPAKAVNPTGNLTTRRRPRRSNLKNDGIVKMYRKPAIMSELQVTKQLSLSG
jgi:hypothetical protein